MSGALPSIIVCAASASFKLLNDPNFVFADVYIAGLKPLPFKSTTLYKVLISPFVLFIVCLSILDLCFILILCILTFDFPEFCNCPSSTADTIKSAPTKSADRSIANTVAFSCNPSLGDINQSLNPFSEFTSSVVGLLTNGLPFASVEGEPLAHIFLSELYVLIIFNPSFVSNQASNVNGIPPSAASVLEYSICFLFSISLSKAVSFFCCNTIFIPALSRI